MITVLPEGGLCNRMRVIASAWLLAQRSGQPMQVLWHRTPDLNASFASLFRVDGLPFFVHEKTAMTRMSRGMFRLREGWARVSGACVLGTQETQPGIFDVEVFVQKLNRKSVFVRTNSRLIVMPGMFEIFQPTGEAARALTELREKLKHSIGVHVRQTDNVKAQQVSTMEAFVSAMHAQRQIEPEVQFFLAADNPAVKAALVSEFGESVWEYPKRGYSRNDPSAIVDAVVDLYALGACRKLIGSYWSSFTDTAAELEGIECRIAGLEEA